MTTAMDLGTARARAESLMSSSCTIREPGSGEPVTDPETGAVTPGAGAVVYAGKCRVRPAATWGRGVEFGGAEVVLSSFRVQIPFAAVGVRVRHRLTVDSSPDPDLVGRVMEVRFVPEMGDNLTARRLTCELLG